MVEGLVTIVARERMMTEANTTYQGEYGRTEIQKQKKKVERKPDEAHSEKRRKQKSKSAREMEQ